MSKLFLFLESIFFLLGTNIAYCAKMPSVPIEKPNKTQSDNSIKTNQDKKQNQYPEKKQSNKNVSDATPIALQGIGTMELAMGISEQQTDKNTNDNINAYIETMYCTYADGKSVKAGPKEIEIPSSEELIKLRQEYFALAVSLKERKKQLGLKPGIESEIIYDKSHTELYDDKNIGIEKSTFESFYRAKTQKSETNQMQIDKNKDTSNNRIIGGAAAIGIGTVVETFINESEQKTTKTKQQTKQKEKK